MRPELTEPLIKSLCGRFSYEDGEACRRAGHVAVRRYEPETLGCEAVVTDGGSFEVTVGLDSRRRIAAQCACPEFDADDFYCRHIAAVLLQIRALQQAGDGARQGIAVAGRQADAGLLRRMLTLFGEKSRRAGGTGIVHDARLPLDMEIICKPLAYRLQNGRLKLMFGIELKVGAKRLYIVQRIRTFLACVERGEGYVFSGRFAYDPELHRFAPEHDALLRRLIETYRYEQMYRDTAPLHMPHTFSISGDRVILIPPFSWATLLPLLVNAPSVRLETEERSHNGIRLLDEPLPIRYDLGETADGGYALGIQGLEKLTVMEDYGVLLCEGKLLKLTDTQGARLSALRSMLGETGASEIRIPAEQMEPFMDKVLPGLMQLGSVHIAKSVSDRMLRAPLQARLYLDRVRNRLLAGLEFQYGDIVINPLEAPGQRRGESRILMRDGERESEILSLIEQCPFARTEGGYFMENEDAEYDFLYHIVPRLEKLLKVYATSAVKLRLAVGGLEPPKVTVDVDERTDWLEFRFQMDGIAESEIRRLLGSLEAKRKYHRLPGGALLPLESAAFQEIIRFMNEVGIRRADLGGLARGGAVHGAGAGAGDTDAGGSGVGGSVDGTSGEGDLGAELGTGSSDSTDSAGNEPAHGGTAGSAAIRLPLVRGLAIDVSQYSGAVKLGKSLRRFLDDVRHPDNLAFPLPEAMSPVLRDYQAYGYQWLKTLAHYRFGGILADDMGLGKTLQSIAFLVSVLPEIRETGVPALIVAPSSLLYNWQNEFRKFAPQTRTVIADGSRSERRRALQHAADVIITSYPLLRIDLALFMRQPFHTLILDEAQFFKNHATQTARAVKAIEARHRFALTGTPVENRLEELWSIYDAVFPALFSGGKRAFQELSREQVAKRTQPFLLRRTKTDVLTELPEKIETVQASELLPEQKKLYLAYLAKLQQETLKHLDKDTPQQHRIKILAGLTRLRQLCCHPALFVEGYAGRSAKFELLLEVIEECLGAGKRMLIFSQFTEMLGIIARELGYRGAPFFYLDGKTPAAERVELCDRFNNGHRDICLISLKAGGTGLNLTGADTVILYDPWWNPAVELQAADRAHRIGQKNVVQVIRLVAQGTIEDKMYELQQRKLGMIDEIVQPGQEPLSALTEQELRELLMVE